MPLRIRSWEPEGFVFLNPCHSVASGCIFLWSPPCPDPSSWEKQTIYIYTLNRLDSGHSPQFIHRQSLNHKKQENYSSDVHFLCKNTALILSSLSSLLMQGYLFFSLVREYKLSLNAKSSLLWYHIQIHSIPMFYSRYLKKMFYQDNKKIYPKI